MDDLEEKYGVAHHGDPILMRRDYDYCRAMRNWIATVRKHGKFGYGPDWLPTDIDILKSRLFWRIRSGIAPLPEPPPCCYSCPWYEVIEELSPHWTGECWTRDGRAYIGQTGYDIVKCGDEGIPEIVRFGGWRFKVWRGKHPQQATIDGWYIQRVPQVSDTTPSPTSEAAGE